MERIRTDLNGNPVDADSVGMKISMSEVLDSRDQISEVLSTSSLEGSPTAALGCISLGLGMLRAIGVNEETCLAIMKGMLMPYEELPSTTAKGGTIVVPTSPTHIH